MLMATQCTLLLLILCMYQLDADRTIEPTHTPFLFDDTTISSTEYESQLDHDKPQKKKIMDTPIIIIFCVFVFCLKILIVIGVYKYVIKGAKPKILMDIEAEQEDTKDTDDSDIQIEMDAQATSTNTHTKDSNRFESSRE